MNRRTFLKNIVRSVGGGIAAYGALMRLGIRHAEAMTLIAGNTESSGGGGAISDDFSGDLSKWTQKSGTWSIAGGELTLTAASGVITYTDAALSTASGYLTVEITDRQAFMGVHFRGTNDASGYMYSFRLNDDNTGVWRYCNDSTTTCTDIQSQDFPASFVNGNYLGLAWSGTGTDTVVEAWRHVGDPGAFATWGAADLTYTTNPGQEANVGTYVGCYHGSTTQGGWDNFEAGDQ